MDQHVRDARLTIDAVARSLVFVLKALPWTSGSIDRFTQQPILEKLEYGTSTGRCEADLYRPPSRGPHPAVVVSLGIVPAGVDHPQRARLGEALARAGFVTLLHWSPAMRDLRLDPTDIGHLTTAYETMLPETRCRPESQRLPRDVRRWIVRADGSCATRHPRPTGVRERLCTVCVDVDAAPRRRECHAHDRRQDRAMAGRSVGVADLHPVDHRGSRTRRGRAAA